MQSGTTENVKLDRRWYDPSDILALDATYNLIYGERGNGKTFSICHLILDAYLSEGLPSAYVRRLDEMIKQGNLETLFSAPEHLKFIEEKTEGKYNFVKYQFHGFYLQKRDPVTNALLAKDPTPFCRTYALSTSETTKGADRGRVKYVFFDEFITRAFYLTNEIVLFESTLESIIRKRPGVKIFMVANTVNKHCPYFKHMGLTNVKKQQQGTIDQYLLGKAGTKIACEYTRECDDAASEIAEQYYCFNNPQVEMIKSGAWEFDLYRTLPKGIGNLTPELTFYIEFDDTVTVGRIYIYNDDPIICFADKRNTPISDRKNKIIYGSEIDSTSPLHQMELARTPTRAQEVILDLFKQHKTYFATNDVGENVANWLKYATKGGLKV